jgi:flagellar secretion chaperone FliS
MGYGKALSQYKRSNIETAGKLDLVIMCYENAILCLAQAKEHLKEQEMGKKVQKFQKALNLISELQCSLNMEKGGLIAKNLDALYSYITKRLLLGDIQKDMTAYDECIHILKELNEAWQTIKSTSNSEQEENYMGKNGIQSESFRAGAY